MFRWSVIGSKAGRLLFSNVASKPVSKKTAESSALFAKLVDGVNTRSLESVLRVYDDASFKFPATLDKAVWYQRIIDLCSKAGRAKRAFSVYNDAKRAGVVPTVDMRLALIVAHVRASKVSDIGDARMESLLTCIENDRRKYGLPDLQTKERNAMLQMYFLSDREKEAFALLNQMRREKKVDAVSYSSYVNHLASKNRPWEESLKLLLEADHANVPMDLGFMHALLSALSLSPAPFRASSSSHPHGATAKTATDVEKRWRLKALEDLSARFFDTHKIVPTTQTGSMMLSVIGFASSVDDTKISVQDIDSFVVQVMKDHGVVLNQIFQENLLDKMTLCDDNGAPTDILNTCWTLFQSLTESSKQNGTPIHRRPLNSLSFLAARKGDFEKVSFLFKYVEKEKLERLSAIHIYNMLLESTKDVHPNPVQFSELMVKWIADLKLLERYASEAADLGDRWSKKKREILKSVPPK
ncbi:mitochondrial pentatricopeptide repeat (PPR) protein [Andalucia godoyi]|uniref:Mitochondrial pentatricopeptide repeat (PPR) protein n=1 Tax=Andalucia godoyi TaxID=505711 RepID=A0A8K0AGN2_ANDGO|nr:mitochondrial pentatricopeptide repeat (PPR) protein [Andalucia godoyi]|eukprot:ANDGO_04006.mRNA.1 mitochondrial pentatricopeptide repeat (PPR) protein